MNPSDRVPAPDGARPAGPASSRHASSFKIELLDPLRGLAALAVTWFHFTVNGPIREQWLLDTGQYGFLGVEVFFVISGFVIPYSMHRGGYRLRRHWSRFLLKRFTRLEPPYLASIAFLVALAYVSAAMPGYRGEPPEFPPAQLLLHLGYLTPFFGYRWLNVVYWTLGIEFQYYLLIAAAYPLLASGQGAVRVATLGVLWATALLVPSPILVCHYLGLFTMGILAFQYHGRVIGLRAYLVATAAAAAVTWFAQGGLIALVGLLTGLSIVFVSLPDVRTTRSPLIRWGLGGLGWFGTISYSLYLLHVPIGARITNLGGRFADSFGARLLVLAAMLAGSLAAAFALYWLVERPSQRLASRIKYD